jgi:hypothetical protein
MTYFIITDQNCDFDVKIGRSRSDQELSSGIQDLEAGFTSASNTICKPTTGKGLHSRDELPTPAEQVRIVDAIEINLLRYLTESQLNWYEIGEDGSAAKCGRKSNRATYKLASAYFFTFRSGADDSQLRKVCLKLSSLNLCAIYLEFN